MPLSVRDPGASTCRLCQTRCVRTRRVIGGLCAAALVLAGCGGHDKEWDSKALNTAVHEHLAGTYSEDFEVACPPNASLREGGHVSCPVHDLDPVLAVVVTTDPDGHLKFTDSFHL